MPYLILLVEHHSEIVIYTIDSIVNLLWSEAGELDAKRFGPAIGPSALKIPVRAASPHSLSR